MSQLTGPRKQANKLQPIVIRRSKPNTTGHHSGGAWKVAYADFITALMAFFLLMWLLISVSPEQKQQISAYFNDVSVSPIQGPGGASTSMIKLGGTKDMEPTPLKHNQIGVMTPGSGRGAQSEEVMQTLELQLRKAIENSQALRPFKDQLLLDITPHGMRLQIVDKKNRPMFKLGSAKLMPYAQVILEQVGAFLSKRPYQISVTGETDARRYVNPNMSNWQLSTERANAAWRALVAGGFQRQRVLQVIGFGDKVLFDKKNPLDPINRRISIVVLTKHAASKLLLDAAFKGSGSRQNSSRILRKPIKPL